MSNGAPPLPISPPGPTEPTEQGGGTGAERREEKCRKTEIVRVYDNKGKYWVDVEVLKNASFLGSQWPGPDIGNQSQETILKLVRNLKTDGSCGKLVDVGMTPKSESDADKAAGSELAAIENSIGIPHRSTTVLESRNNVARKFAVKKDMECCKGIKRRIAFNHLSEEFLKAEEKEPGKDDAAGGAEPGTEGERPPFQEGGPPIDQPDESRSLRRTGAISSRAAAPSQRASNGDVGGNKVPPKSPKDYKKAVRASDDGSDFFLDICIPKSSDFNRSKGFTGQKARPSKIWGSGNNPLPGASKKTEDKGPHFQLDPYQVPVNFGPDGLAVEFHKGANGGEDDTGRGDMP